MELEPEALFWMLSCVSGGPSHGRQRPGPPELVCQSPQVEIKGLKLGSCRFSSWLLYQSQLQTDPPGSYSLGKLSPAPLKGQSGDMSKNGLTPRPALCVCVGGLPGTGGPRY